MTPGLTITVIDPDNDYLGIEIQACTDRYSGTAKIYAGFDELSQFAAEISGFPKHRQALRAHQFGSV